MSQISFSESLEFAPLSQVFLRNLERLACRSIWNSHEARFEDCYLLSVSALPLAVAIIVLALRFGRPLFRYLPRWTKPFIEEPESTGKEFWITWQRIPTLQGRAFSTLLLLGCIANASVVLGPGTPIVGLLPLGAWVILAFLMFIDATDISASGALTILLSIIFTHAVDIASQRSQNRTKILLQALTCIIAACSCIAVANFPLRKSRLPKDGICGAFIPPTCRLGSPEENLSVWQFMSVSWMTPLISIGSARQLNDEDVWSLPFEFRHKVLHEHFRQLKGSVVMRLLAANGVDLIITTTLAIVESVSNYAAPVLLQLLLQSMEDVQAPQRAAITYATIALVVRLIATQSSVFSLWYCRRSYERSRGEMITMLYEKTLKRQLVTTKINPASTRTNGSSNGALSDAKSPEGTLRRIRSKAKQVVGKVLPKFRHEVKTKAIEEPASMGKILNMMRNDVYEVAQRFWEFQNLITQPLGLILSILLVWKLMGWSTLMGVAVVIVAQLLNVLFTRILLYWERKRRSATDARLQRTTEYVEAIRHLRWYGWQDLWQDRIMCQRQRELNLRIITNMCNILIGFTNSLASLFFPVVAFFAYTSVAKRPLRVDVAFPALQLFNMLENSLRDIPGLITVLLNAKVAVDRIEGFMAEPDKEEEINLPASSGPRLELKNCSFAWPGAEGLVLQYLNLSFPLGLSLISGKVAAGKSALLQALLGELDRRNGQILKEQAMIGYCSQTPWLQSMSIRDNILFSYPYDEARYTQVLDCCALNTDLASFRDGDRSNIGEHGIGLSGGQRARVALARAVYSRANVLLLDDPLSALDHQTASFIVRKLFRGSLMKDRAVLLVTHRIELCHMLAVQHIEIERGRAHEVSQEPVIVLERQPSSPEQIQRRLTSTVTRGESDKEPEKFTEDEHRSHGNVKLSIYWEYVKAGKLWLWMILIMLIAVHQVVSVGKTWLLKEWGEAYNTVSGQISSGPFRSLPPPEDDVRPWLIWFALVAMAQSLLYLVSRCIMLAIVYCAGRRMFRGLISRVGRATFRFYDVTPVGRLMNRLTSDVGTIDGNISQQFHQVAWISIRWILSLLVIASVTPTFLVFSFVLSFAFIVIFWRFLPTSQSLRRLEMVSLSPLMSNFGALLDGLVTVRAFGVQGRFQDRLIVVVDAFQKMDHFYWSLQAWLMYRFDILSACSEWILTLLAIYTGVSPGLTAFVLIAASRFVRSTHSLCKQYGKLQMDFVSVERVVEMLHMEQEPLGTIQPPASWPRYNGDIVFENVTMRYAPHLDPSLSNVSFRIPGGSTTALLGRTGSGKSTLALSLLATNLPESGRILIDGIDIANIDRQTLRSRVTFLAQDPVLFPGPMRANLDPLDEFSDEMCELVIQRIGGNSGWSRDTEISAGGLNLSQGQRQLIGLARAILRRSAVVILDEATASIDMETALQVQRILREELTESTVITIAHRLEAVEHADYQLRLDHGRLVSSGPTDATR